MLVTTVPNVRILLRTNVTRLQRKVVRLISERVREYAQKTDDKVIVLLTRG